MRQSYYWILKALHGAGQRWAIQRLVLGIEACQGKCVVMMQEPFDTPIQA